MRGIFVPSCILITLALCTLCNADFIAAPPADVTAVVGQTVRLHWEYPQTSAETMTISLAKHVPGDIEFIVECINSTENAMLCYNGTGYVTVMMENANKRHQARYELAITNGFKDRQFSNIHVIGVNTTLLDAEGVVLYMFPQNSSEDMDEYNIIIFPEVELNCSSEYTILMTISDSEFTNVTCFLAVANQLDYHIYRANQSEVRYHFYTFPYLVNQPVHLECVIRETIMYFILRHKVRVNHTVMPRNTPPGLDKFIESIRLYFHVMCGLLGVILTILVMPRVYQLYYKCQMSTGNVFCGPNSERDSGTDFALVPQADILRDILTVVGNLKESVQLPMRKPRVRTLSDRSESG